MGVCKLYLLNNVTKENEMNKAIYPQKSPYVLIGEKIKYAWCA